MQKQKTQNTEQNENGLGGNVGGFLYTNWSSLMGEGVN